MAEKYGIKISKPGVVVQDAGYDELIFTSEFPLFKIHAQGSGSATLNASGNATVTIAHGLSEKPYFLVYSQFYNSSGVLQTSYALLSFTVWPLGGLLADIYIHNAYVDDTNLNIRYDMPSSKSGATIKYIYYIFEDPIFF